MPSRRALLSTLLGAGATAGAGYLGSVAASRSGRVVVRYVAGRRVADGTSRDVDVYHAELHRDGTVDRREYWSLSFEEADVGLLSHLNVVNALALLLFVGLLVSLYARGLWRAKRRGDRGNHP